MIFLLRYVHVYTHICACYMFDNCAPRSHACDWWYSAGHLIEQPFVRVESSDASTCHAFDFSLPVDSIAQGVEQEIIRTNGFMAANSGFVAADNSIVHTNGFITNGGDALLQRSPLPRSSSSSHASDFM